MNVLRAMRSDAFSVALRMPVDKRGSCLRQHFHSCVLHPACTLSPSRTTRGLMSGGLSSGPTASCSLSREAGLRCELKGELTFAARRWVVEERVETLRPAYAADKFSVCH